MKKVGCAFCDRTDSESVIVTGIGDIGLVLSWQTARDVRRHWGRATVLGDRYRSVVSWRYLGGVGESVFQGLRLSASGNISSYILKTEASASVCSSIRWRKVAVGSSQSLEGCTGAGFS